MNDVWSFQKRFFSHKYCILFSCRYVFQFWRCDVKNAKYRIQSIEHKDIFTYASMMKVYNLDNQPLKIAIARYHQVTVFISVIDACS